MLCCGHSRCPPPPPSGAGVCPPQACQRERGGQAYPRHQRLMAPQMLHGDVVPMGQDAEGLHVLGQVLTLQCGGEGVPPLLQLLLAGRLQELLLHLVTGAVLQQRARVRG